MTNAEVDTLWDYARRTGARQAKFNVWWVEARRGAVCVCVCVCVCGCVCVMHIHTCACVL